MPKAFAPRPAEHGYPRGGLHGQVVHAVGRRIVSGDIRPGEVLPADFHLRASRTVVREAIKVLAAKGLVESRPKTGTRVRPPESWNLLDPDVLAWQQEGMPQPVFLRKLTEVRLIVEPAAAELAAKRARVPEVAALEAALRDMTEALQRSPADFEAFDQADIRFHRAILQACDNDVLERMSAMVYSALLVSFHATSRLPGRARASLPRHRAILEGIRAHDSRRAGVAMRRLVQTTADAIEDLPRKRKRPPPV
jgi:GntR family galactonate operon transcriptional repressor